MDALLIGNDRLAWGDRSFRCAIGRNGISAAKQEGDGATPVGLFPFRRILFRPDRIARPETAFDIDPIGPQDGWCDDPTHADYNRQIVRPFSGRHERLWREDHLYDLIIVLGHNDSPPRPYTGSAIFFHVAGDDYPPTEGCVAVKLTDLLTIVGECADGDGLRVTPPQT